MIYFESQNVDWKILVNSWILTMETPWMKGNVTLFEEMFDWLLPCSIDFVQKFGKLLINTTTQNLVQYVPFYLILNEKPNLYII